ncbi:hypothetical protein DFS34DRAFT_272056 [Phlyctochytrium arcticum]|nr:hypothetical protein DFS34DRAFT_272056 [Phlyctochytrium arcticum]
MDDDPICSICLEEVSVEPDRTKTSNDNFQVPSPIALLKVCGHIFHSNCILESLETHSSCPNCRCKIPRPRGKHSLWFVPRIGSREEAPTREDDEDDVITIKKRNKKLECQLEAMSKSAERLRTTQLCTQSDLEKLRDLHHHTEKNLQQALRQLAKNNHEKEKYRLNLTTAVQNAVLETKTKYKQKLNQALEYSRTLEGNLRKAELISMTHKSHDPTFDVDGSIEGLTTVSQLKETLRCYYTKLQACKQDLAHWKAMASSNSKQVKSGKKELEQVRAELSLEKVNLALEKSRTGSERENYSSLRDQYEQTRSEAATFKARYLALKESVHSIQGKLDQANKELAIEVSRTADAADRPLSTSSPRSSTSVANHPTPTTSNPSHPSTPAGSRRNPFAALPMQPSSAKHARDTHVGDVMSELSRSSKRSKADSSSTSSDSTRRRASTGTPSSSTRSSTDLHRDRVARFFSGPASKR